MAHPRLVPSKQEMEAYLRQGLKHQQIADAWERDSGNRVTRNAICLAIGRYGLRSNHPRPRYEDMLPWHVKVEHLNHLDAKMLRLEGRRRHGFSLTDSEKRRLKAWRDQLTEMGAVVTYNPNTEDGFFWIPRTDDDGGDIIRRPRVADSA